jgi:ribonuclease P protein component
MRNKILSKEAFQKNRRLLRRGDFEAVFSASRSKTAGGSVRKGPFILYWKDQATEGARLGLSIPRRVIKSAVKRNRVKRCLREYFRKLPQGCRGDYVIRLIHAPELVSVPALTPALDRLKLQVKSCR